jgi:hypothetical protein
LKICCLVEFEKGEEPHLLTTGKYKTEGNKACLALSPDGSVLALASASTLTIINAITSKIDKTITNIYSGKLLLYVWLLWFVFLDFISFFLQMPFPKV